MTVRQDLALRDPPCRDLGEHFDTLFQTSSDCLFLVEPDSKSQLVYVAINESGQKHLPVPWHAAKGRTPSSVLGGEAGATISAKLTEVFKTGITFSYQPTFSMAAGEVVFDAVYTAVRDRAGVITGVLGVARDITIQRRLGEALAKPQRDQAVGALAASYARDVSMLLGHLTTHLHCLRYDLSASLRRQMIAEGLLNTTRANTLLDRILAAAREDELNLQPTDLRPILRRLQSTMQEMIHGSCQISVVLDDGLKSVVIDSACFELVLVELVVAAAGVRGSEVEKRSVSIGATNLPTVANDKGGPRQEWIAVTLTSASNEEERLSEGCLQHGRKTHVNGLALELAALTIERMGGRIHRSVLPSLQQTMTIELPCTNCLPTKVHSRC